MASFSGTVIGGSLNLRATASTSGTKLASIPNSTSLTVSTVSSARDWLSTTYSSSSGYVLAQYIYAKSSTEGTVSTTSGSLNIRATPSASATVIYTLASGRAVYILDKTSVSGWYQISTGSGTGWASSSYINTGSSSSVSGVTGSGPNSKYSAADIRAGNGSWQKDTATTHPQIAVMQGFLNKAAILWGASLSLTTDGIFGANTQTVVVWYQGLSTTPKLTVDGFVGKNTLTKLESQYSQIN